MPNALKYENKFLLPAKDHFHIATLPSGIFMIMSPVFLAFGCD